MNFILLATLLTVGAAAFALLLHRFKLSSTLAYLLFGMVLAPFSHSLFQSLEEAESLAEIGVILLMFTAGLGIDKSQVQSMLRLFLGGGSLQVALVALVLGTGAWLLGCNWPEAVVIGLMLACSSTAVILKAYEEAGEGDSHKARVSVAVSLFQDILVVIALGMLPLLKLLSGEPVNLDAASEPRWRLILQLIGLPMLCLPLLYIVSNWILPRLFTRLVALRSKELFSLLSLACCLLIALGAQFAGGSMAIGAFMGGLVLARTPFAAQIMGELQVIRNLGLGLFFIMLGLLVNMHYVWQHALELAACFLAFLLIKAVLDTLAIRILRVPLALALAVGVALAQVSELAFILGSHAEESGILSSEHYQFVLSLAVISMLSSPFLVKIGNAAERFCRKHSVTKKISEKPTLTCAEEEDIRLCVVVVGYGPVGRMVVDKLICDGIQPHVIDLNHHSIAEIHELGLQGIYGDAGNTAVMLKAGVDRADTIFITIPDLSGRTAAIHVARQLNPAINIYTRARFLNEVDKLESAGATRVFFEEREVALAMTKVLEKDKDPLIAPETATPAL